MNVFFDTSSLFKLYHKESGTEKLMDFFNNNQIDSLYLAEITQIEFSSAVWKICLQKLPQQKDCTQNRSSKTSENIA